MMTLIEHSHRGTAVHWRVFLYISHSDIRAFFRPSPECIVFWRLKWMDKMSQSQGRYLMVLQKYRHFHRFRCSKSAQNCMLGHQKRCILMAQMCYDIRVCVLDCAVRNLGRPCANITTATCLLTCIAFRRQPQRYCVKWRSAASTAAVLRQVTTPLSRTIATRDFAQSHRSVPFEERFYQYRWKVLLHTVPSGAHQLFDNLARLHAEGGGAPRKTTRM